MSRTSRKPFRNQTFVKQVNNPLKVDGQFVANWVFEDTLEGQMVPGSTAYRGIKYDKADSSVAIKILFRTDPKLTANHRLLFQGRTLLFQGVIEPMESGRLWEVFVEESTAEQAAKYMDMGGVGFGGGPNEVHMMRGGGLSLDGEADIDDELSSSSSASASSSSASSGSSATAPESDSSSSSGSASSGSSSSSSPTSGSSSSSSSSSPTTGSSASSSSGSTVTASSSSSGSSSTSSASTSSLSTSSSSLV